MTERNIFSEYLALPKDSPKHRQFREELWLGTPCHACRYYLSMLLHRDFFAVSDDEFLTALQEYVVGSSCREAIQFCSSILYLQFILPFLKQAWETAEGIANQRRLGKEEQAMILLIRHPDWPNERFRQAVRTTEKQMRRWSTFNYARNSQKRLSEIAAAANPRYNL
jgi:hypothetical protein